MKNNTTKTHSFNLPSRIESDLEYFTCTSAYYFYSNFPFVYTDGIFYVASQLNAYWLLDLISSYQKEIKSKHSIKLQDYQFWTLKASNNKGIVTCDIDKDETVITQAIDYTDFPLPEIKLWLINMSIYWGYKGNERRGCNTDRYGILTLPSEY